MKISIRILALLFTLLLLPYHIMYASEVTEVYAYLDESTIVTGGTSPFGEGHTVTVKIMQQNEMIFFQFTKTKENGSFEFRCELNPLVHPTGNYTIVLSGAGLDAVTVPDEIKFLGGSEAEALLKSINQSKTAQEMESVLTENANVIGIRLDGAITLVQNKTTVYSFLAEQHFNSLPHVANVFNTATAIQQINESDSSKIRALLSDYADLLELPLDDVRRLTEQQQEAVYSLLSNTQIGLSADELKKDFDAVVYTVMINDLGSDDAELILNYLAECNQKRTGEG